MSWARMCGWEAYIIDSRQCQFRWVSVQEKTATGLDRKVYRLYLVLA